MEATDPVTITLQAQQWNIIIDVLHSAAYRISAPLIHAIIEQAAAAEAAALKIAQDNLEPPRAWGNGASEHPSAE